MHQRCYLFKHSLPELIASNTSSQDMLRETPPTYPTKRKWRWSHLSYLHLISWYLCSFTLLHSFSLQRFPSVLSPLLPFTHFPFWFEATSGPGIKSFLCMHTMELNTVCPINVTNSKLRQQDTGIFWQGWLFRCWILISVSLWRYYTASRASASI